MIRDQTANFRNSAAPFFLGSIALAQLNFSFSRLRIVLLGRLSRGRSKFTEDDFRHPPPGACSKSPHLNRDEQGDD
jgi:hypothetical protein